jgi:hypothetical protein
MSTPVIYNGVTYNVPSFADIGYAQNAGNMSAYWIALATGSLQKTGGAFTLTADANFGPNFGLLAKYFTSIVSNAATAGVLRLAVTDTIDWRNNANGANLALGIDGSDNLTFGGTAITLGGITALTGDVTASGPGSAAATLATVNADVGSFTNASITVDGKGRILAATNGTGSGDLTDVGTDGITITGGTGAVLGSGTSISQHVADASHNGYLSSTDWSTFNAGGSGITALTSEVTATGPGSAAATVSNSAVIAKVLTGFTSGSGTVSASDSILTALEKINANQQLNIDKLQTITWGSTISPDASAASTFSISIAGTTTINGPSNPTDGQKVIFQLIYGGTGHTVTFATGSGNFKFGTTVPSYPAGSINTVDYIGAIYYSSSSVWHVVSLSQGF